MICYVREYWNISIWVNITNLYCTSGTYVKPCTCLPKSFSYLIKVWQAVQQAPLCRGTEHQHTYSMAHWILPWKSRLDTFWRHFFSPSPVGIISSRIRSFILPGSWRGGSLQEALLEMPQGASLVAQWIRICLPMQGTWILSLVWVDPTCWETG